MAILVRSRLVSFAGRHGRYPDIRAAALTLLRGLSDPARAIPYGRDMYREIHIEGLRSLESARRIEGALLRIRSVRRAEVILEPPTARVDYDAPTDLKLIRTAIQSVGDYSLSESVERPQAPSAAPEYRPFLLHYLFIPLLGALALSVGLFFVITGRLAFDQVTRILLGSLLTLAGAIKVADLKGFSRTYPDADRMVAGRPMYATLFPFLELGLGLLFLFGFDPLVLSLVTFLSMVAGSIIALRSLLRGRAGRSSLFGAKFEIPVTRIVMIQQTVIGLFAAATLLHHLDNPATAARSSEVERTIPSGMPRE